ncbi:uncharacterized protein VTP21DRAFT_4867 [Calcarisporiella thermophila]|uniref:uncharacterized protein n=1 Tax=Calcarisporiella thermophila TaxID=911321 RepID=UPI003744036A
MDTLRQRHLARSEKRDIPFSDVREGEKYDRLAKKPLTKKNVWDIALPLLLTFFAFFTRFVDIDYAKYVVWDEAHFGKFASHYLKREFYFDVHPPLGKMLIGLSGILAGYDGSFDFESGKDYPENVNYSVMRLFCAAFGALIVPIAYFTALELKYSRLAALVVGTMILLDNALLTISRFILLDSILLFFTSTSFYCLAKFHNCQNEPFSTRWWAWLFLTGVSIGCVSSVKWVGLFAVALVGLYTVLDLWNKLGDLQMPVSTYIKHWMARIVCLILVPIAIYLACFAIHFAILTRSGPGDAQMTSLFQAGLIGNDLDKSPVDVIYGSNVTIKNSGFGGGLLHSHVQAYPVGSKQQQVTCYHHKDDNNDWIFLPPLGEPLPSTEGPFTEVKDGDVVRVLHRFTGHTLHSHAVEAPVTKSQWEVSCYGNATFGDDNDLWRVEIVDDTYGNVGHLRTLLTRFRLRHKLLGCLLAARRTNLPQWGFKQIEVTCEKDNPVNDPYAMWNIEKHWHENLPPPPKNFYRARSNFLKNVIHLNVAMMTSNNAMTPDPNKEDIISSLPREWPLLTVGLRMCNWADDAIKFYLLGNPIVWWSSIGSIGLFALILMGLVLRQKRQMYDLRPEQWYQMLHVGQLVGIGWLLHYLPFWIMGRVTYLHHYFPALYFSAFMPCYLIEGVLTVRLPSFARITALLALLFAVVVTFVYFADISFGVGYPSRQLKHLRWRKSWNIADD